ncbi:helix-turn-helix transcriptional regulator [Labrys sp. ZIDIC5]|uniref:helix-turn-helix transcriptional regulator n=1 Tax=Labrys sedimenti TaxID=3106036 RepID=UPI002ACA62E6|nr:helix-turn-helix transcriptional regulator [Labrys sp. ZIDIC5]MDZ5454870.1 helix-turn-helix transcriptional regulator [Labrys sp. ZIDIC5]
MSSKPQDLAVGVVKEAIDAAAFNPEAWQEVVSLIASNCPGSRPALVAIDPLAVRGAPMVWYGWDPGTLNAYERHYCQVNPWTPFMAKLAPLSVVVTEKVLPVSMLQRSEFYNDWMRPVGGIDAAIALKIYQEADRVAWMIVHHDIRHFEQQNGFLEPLLAAVGPVMRRSLAANRIHLKHKTDLRDYGLIDAIAEPALLIEADGHVLHANTLAQPLLSAGSPFRLDAQGNVQIEIRSQQTHFAAALRAACSCSHQYSDSVRVGSSSAFRILIVPVDRGAARPSMRPLYCRYAAALIIRPERDAGAPKNILKHDFGLTEAEYLTCTYLVGGINLHQIAGAMGCSYETVRSHLKRIYAKTGRHRQAELMAFLQQLQN